MRLEETTTFCLITPRAKGLKSWVCFKVIHATVGNSRLISSSSAATVGFLKHRPYQVPVLFRIPLRLPTSLLSSSLSDTSLVSFSPPHSFLSSPHTPFMCQSHQNDFPLAPRVAHELLPVGFLGPRTAPCLSPKTGAHYHLTCEFTEGRDCAPDCAWHIEPQCFLKKA